MSVNYKYIISNFKWTKQRIFLMGAIVLFAIVFAVRYGNPHLKSLRDTQRRSDVEAILAAVYSYIEEHQGVYPPGIKAGMTEVQLGTSVKACKVNTGSCNVTNDACVNLSAPLAKYLKTFPKDPKSGKVEKTNYSIIIESNHVITVKACGTEGDKSISATK